MSFKILTLNVWDGGRDLDAVIAFLQHENPDILALQEVYDGHDSALEQRFRTMDVLRESLHYPTVHFAKEFTEDRPEGLVPQGNAVFSRFPATHEHTNYFFRPPDERYVEVISDVMDISHNLEHLILDTPDGKVHFINFHGPKNNNGDEDSEARQIAVSTILQEIEGHKNVIIAGDTNARPTNASIQKLSAHIHNVFGTELTTTFNMKKKSHPGYATSVVDMIFVSDDFEILENYQPQVDVSDHLPLVVKLQLRPK